MRLGDREKDYYVGALTNPGTSAGAETAPMGPAAAGRRVRHDPTVARGRRRRLRCRWRGGDLLDPRPTGVIGALGMVCRPQRGALGALAGADDALPGRVLRGAGRAVHRHGADHRLHRRDHDAVPVRADAGRSGCHRLADRSAAGPAGGRGPRSDSASPAWSGRRSTGRWTAGPRSSLDQANAAGNVQGSRRAVHQVRLRVRADLGAADHGRGGCDGAGAHRAPQGGPEDQAAGAMRARFAPGNYPGPKPGPGVYRHHHLGGHAGSAAGRPVDRRRPCRRSCPGAS